MNDRLWLEHKWRNRLHTAAILVGLGLLLATLGLLLGGQLGLIWILFLGGVILAFGPRVSPTLILKMQRARLLSPYQAGELYQMAGLLAKRAGLAGMPQLFLIPTRGMNAFALELSKNVPAIALTSGLLNTLSPRELMGVLAHEISHLAHRDTKVMHLAAVMNHMVGTFAGFGRILLLLAIPIFVLTGTMLNWFPLLLMALAPIPSHFLHLALSRTREFDADLGAAEITGDPEGLAMALSKLDGFERGFFHRLLMPHQPQGDWLQTHPQSQERIRRLRNLIGRSHRIHPTLSRQSHPQRGLPFQRWGNFLL